MSDKIQPQHVARKAVLYVRQSSQHQGVYNQTRIPRKPGLVSRMAAQNPAHSPPT